VHVALQGPPAPQVSVPHAALPPPQVSVQLPPVLHEMSLHALLPWQSAVHVPAPQVRRPQT
jgi:hypothetical protein